MEKTNYKYTKNYCEENIWQLCKHPDLQTLDKKVLVISNVGKNCPLWAHHPLPERNPVWWDYHVVLIARENGRWWVYDFDSTLDFPSDLATYFNQTFQSGNLPEATAPLFKCFTASHFTDCFFSDRGHMQDAAGNWIFTPPPWPNIEHALGNKLEMKEILDFSESSQHEILLQDELKTSYL